MYRRICVLIIGSMFVLISCEKVFEDHFVKTETVVEYQHICDNKTNYDVRNDLGRIKTYTIPNVETIADTYLDGEFRYLDGGFGAYKDLDENYIPEFAIDGVPYNQPVTTCHTAFACYNSFFNVSKYDSSYFYCFVNNVDYIYNYRDDNGYLVYDYYKLHVGRVPIRPPWVSAMAQGEALGLMCMAYNMLGDKKYLEAAHDFFDTLVFNRYPYWCVTVDENGYYWMEEYPTDDMCHVLNGKLIGMWGLWNYYCITRNQLALTLFQAGIRSVLDNIDFWNVPGENASQYCTHENSVNMNYHDVHTDIFYRYYDRFDIPEFKEARDLFRSEE